MGHWKNFEEIEETLCLAEVELILDAARERRAQDRKFMASIQGIDLPDEEKPSDGPSFEEVVNRAKAKARGISAEAHALKEIGFEVEED